jgi:hypothetical protein
MNNKKQNPLGFKEVKMSYEKWEAKFVPMRNKFDGFASYDGCLYETYGDELTYVLLFANNHFGETSDRQVWTLVEEDGKFFVVEGYRLVNRFGYLLTENKAEVNTCYTVKV